MTVDPRSGLQAQTDTLAEEFDRKMRSDALAAIRRVYYLGAELQRRAHHGDPQAVAFWRGQR